jgi:hypothetical protein
LREQKKTLKKQLEKTDGQRQRLIKSIAKGLISDDEAEKVIKEIRQRDTLLKEEIEKISDKFVKEYGCRREIKEINELL